MIATLESGIKLAYDDVGEGLPLLFVHGFPHNRLLWSQQVGALSRHARCVTPDLRGFGRSDVAPPFTIDQYADDLAALLGSLGIGQTIVAGLSMGGYVALSLWRRHRDQVRALILADTRAGADGSEAKAKRDELIALVRSSGTQALAEAQITGMLGKTTREKSPELVADVKRMLASAPPEGAIGALAAMRHRPDSTALLSEINVPTLIIVGEEDVLTPPKEARQMHEAIRGSVLQEIPGAGHLSNLERPGTFNQLVREFLSTIRN